MNKMNFYFLICIIAHSLFCGVSSQQAFNFFYPGGAYNAMGADVITAKLCPLPYNQYYIYGNWKFSNITFVSYDPIMLMIMYYLYHSDIANLAKILETIDITNLNNTVKIYSGDNAPSGNYKTIKVLSKLDSWSYLGSPSNCLSGILYPVLAMAQSPVSLYLMLEYGASPNLLGYSPSNRPDSDQAYGKVFVNSFRTNSALLAAIQQNNIDNVKILLSYGADPNLSNAGLKFNENDNATNTPYLYAKKNASANINNLLEEFQGGKIFSNSATHDLQEGIINGDISQIQNAYQNGGNINATILYSGEEMSIIQYIILQADTYPKYNIINTLFNLTKGIAINQKSSIHGTTPLLAAICIKDSGKKSTCKNCTGMTELENIIALLAQNGADPFALDNNKISAYQVINSKLDTLKDTDPEYNSIAQKMVALINNLTPNLLTVGYYLYNLSLVSISENLDTNIINTFTSKNAYPNLIESDEPTLENIVNIIKKWPSNANWQLMHKEVESFRSIIAAYIKSGESLNAKYNGKTMIQIAQENHQQALANWIEANFKKILIFIQAVLENDINTVKMAIQNGIDINLPIDGNNNTALIQACINKNTDLVKILIAAGANVNKQNKLKHTPLYVASTNQSIEKYDIMKVLLEHNADINAIIDSNKNTILLIACTNNDSKLINFLLSNKANVNKANNIGETPLLNAVNSGDLNIVNILVNNNAEINTENNAGETPLSQSISNNKYDITKLLISKGANINYINKRGIAIVLNSAVNNKNSEFIDLLVKSDINTNLAIDANDSNALFIALKNNNYNVAQALLKAKFNINAIAYKWSINDVLSGQSILTYFMLTGNLKAIKFLLNNKANIHTRGKTHMALEFDTKKISENLYIYPIPQAWDSGTISHENGGEEGPTEIFPNTPLTAYASICTLGPISNRPNNICSDPQIKKTFDEPLQKLHQKIARELKQMGY